MDNFDINYYLGLSRALAYLAQVQGDGSRSERTTNQHDAASSDPAQVRACLPAIPAPTPFMQNDLGVLHAGIDHATVV